MEQSIRIMIEKHVIDELSDAFLEDGLAATVELGFIDFDWDLWEIVKCIIPEDDDDEYDRIILEAELIAKNQFNVTMNKLTTAFMIIDGALNITGK